MDVDHLHGRLAAAGVHTLIAQFTDLHGVAKGKFLPLAGLAGLLTQGAGFSGPSIWGTGLPRTGPRSEYHGRGDAATAVALPWMPGYARVACDGFVAGEPFDACPRQVLKRQVARLAERGWVLQAGIEPEFFLLRRSERGLVPADADDLLAKPSYDLKSLPRQRDLLAQLGAGLAACGFTIQQIDHEDAHGQFELNFANSDALTSADRVMLFKMAAHAIAEEHGMVFSMMPKPFADQPGSGMHFHLSLWDGARCVFDDPAGDLSPLAWHFIAGVLEHSAALCAIAAPTVNSYKRLVVGGSITGTSWAPASIAHGPNNRTALVRTLPGRFEWRLPDASANPYLALAAVIAAGLDGIDRKLDPAPACEDDLFDAAPALLCERGIATLPQGLADAVASLERDEIIGAALGATLTTQFIDIKRREAIEYARHVSDWELQRYAAMF